MNILTRNIVLIVLFTAIQYQLWFSPYGMALLHGLQDEMLMLSSQYQQMKKQIRSIAPALMAEAREELIEDQAREVYHYVAEDETFVAWGDAQSPEKTKKKSS